MHWPDELKEFEGQDATHFPFEASWLFAQVKQNVEDPAQELQDESHAVQATIQQRGGELGRRMLTSARNVVLGVKERA